jgi:hypothetical protein
LGEVLARLQGSRVIRPNAQAGRTPTGTAYLETLLRQFEYEANLRVTDGKTGADTAWLREQLDMPSDLADRTPGQRGSYPGRAQPTEVGCHLEVGLTVTHGAPDGPMRGYLAVPTEPKSSRSTAVDRGDTGSSG